MIFDGFYEAKALREKKKQYTHTRARVEWIRAASAYMFISASKVLLILVN